MQYKNEVNQNMIIDQFIFFIFQLVYDIKIKKKPKKSMSTIDEIIKKYNYQADLLSDQSTKTQQNDQNFQHQETTNLNNKFIVANQINQEQQQDKEEDDEDYDYDLDLKQLSQLVATKKNQILKEESTRQQQNFTLSNNLQEKKIQVKQPSIITFPKESKLLQLINPTQTFQQQTNNLNANQSLFGLQSTPQSNINPQFTQSLNNEVFKDQNFEVSIRQTELSDQQSINNQSFDKINLDSSFNSQYSPREPSSPASSQKSSRSSYQYTIPIVHTNQEYLNRNFLQQLQAKGVKIFLQEELSIQEYSGNYYKIFNNHYEILKSLSKDQLQILTNIVQELVIKDVLLTLKYSQFKECATAISVQDDYNIFCQYFLNRENLPYMEKSYSYLFQKKNIKKKEQMLLAFDPFSCNRRQRFLIIFSLILMYYKICNLEVKILELLEYSVKGGVNYDFIYIFTNIYPQIYLPVGLNKTYENKKKVYQISEKEITKLIYLKEYYQFNISDVHYQILDKQININNDSQKMKPQNKQFDKQKQKTTENIIQNIFQNSDQIQIEEKIDKSHSESQEFQSKNYNNLSEYSCLIQTLRLIIIIVIYQEYMRCQSYQQRIKIHQQLQLIESYLRLNTDKSKVDEVILKQINQNDVTKRLQEEVLGYKKNYMFFLKSNQNSFEEDMIMNFMLRYYIIFGDFQLQKWVKSQADFFIHFNYYDFIGSFNLLTEFIKQTNLNIAEKVYLNVLKGYFTNPKYCYTILKTLQIVNIYKITKIISNQNSIIEIRHNFQKILEGSSNNTQKQYEFQDIDSQIVQNFFL